MRDMNEPAPAPFVLHLGDCIAVMRAMPDCSVDAIVTDPPYELGFMGKSWDASGIANSVEMWREALRVLKPGGHLLSFSGSRTYHRMAAAIEDAGFEIRDQIMWVYGSGFPKSKNLGGEWEGWGTALKPAHEPICVARKPLVGTVAENVQQHGVGAINIAACRVETSDNLNGGAYAKTGGRAALDGDSRVGAAQGMFQQGKTVGLAFEQPLGRWPANLIHDGSDDVLAAFPDSNGSGPARTLKRSKRTGEDWGMAETPGDLRDAGTGSAARFFYCAKASRADRNKGLTDPGPQFSHGATLRRVENTVTGGNNHPTVKPTALMRYLVRLVTPPGGLVLDPFMGSGSTGKACMREGFRFVGIDMTQEYVEIARARIAHEWESVVAAVEAAAAPAPQRDLFEEVA